MAKNLQRNRETAMEIRGKGGFCKRVKSIAKLQKCALFGLALAVFFLSSARLIAANATVFDRSAATATELARAARNLPDSERLRTTQAALSIVLLLKFDRLLPNLSPAALDQIANIFFSENPDPTEQEATAAKFPPADSLVFDGSRLVGGNFRNIDALVGLGGRPIALDRELPSWIVPLESARAQALDSTRAAGLTSQKFAELQSLFNRIHNADVSGRLVADGIFLRPYAGKMDDLYHQLAQKGGREGQLDYFAILDSLPARQYSPIAGTAAREFVPPPRVNLSNILSGGSLQAIQNFKAANPRANVKNPFKGLAVRTVPYIGDQLRKTAPGRNLSLSGELMRRAISDPRRFSPPQAPPLFHDPSRFLGQWEDPRFLFVAKKKKNSNTELFAEIQKVDFETPLPELSFEPAGNELLSQTSETAAPSDTQTLLEDLGMPPQKEETGYAPADAPEPVLPPTRIKDTDAPTPEQPLQKPAPPLLDIEPLETPPVVELAQASTPPPPRQEFPAAPPPPPIPAPTAEPPATSPPAPSPTPAALDQPSPVATPTPQFQRPSAIAVIEPAVAPSATPAQPTPAPKTEETEPRVAKAIPVAPSRQDASDFSGSTANRFQVAVLTPTAVEAIDYLKKIAASDIALSENLAASRREDCVIRWLGEAVKPFEPLLTQTPDSKEAVAVQPFIVQARDEIVALLENRETLQAARMLELKNRQAARQAIEKEIQTTRRDELARRTGTGV